MGMINDSTSNQKGDNAHPDLTYLLWLQRLISQRVRCGFEVIKSIFEEDLEGVSIPPQFYYRLTVIYEMFESVDKTLDGFLLNMANYCSYDSHVDEHSER